MTAAALSVHELTKIFPSSRSEGSVSAAVDAVTFDVAPGSSTAIVGESGSGKTTTARMIAGLESRTSGRILIEGQERREPHGNARERRLHTRQVQMVFQDPYASLDPRQKIGAGIVELLRIGGIGDPRSRASRMRELLQSVGLDQRHEDLLPRALSGGQRQRVAIARALVPEPKLLILDESVSALDVSVQAQIIELLNNLRREADVTYLFISHDLAVVEQVSDHVIVMRKGQVVEAGSTAQILHSPQRDYTRRLLAAIPRPNWDFSRTGVTRPVDVQSPGTVREIGADR